MSSYDFKQLSSAVSRSDINKYRKQGYRLSDKIAPAYHFVPVIGFVFGVMGYLPARIVEEVIDNSFYPVVIVVIFVVVGFLEGWYLCVNIPKKAWVRLVRLARFSQDNKLGYTPEAAGSAGDGLLFSQPNVFETFDVIYKTLKDDREFEFGNASIIRANVITPLKAYDWGFIRIKLDQPVPHIIIDGKLNDHLLARTNLPENFRISESFRDDEHLNQYFTIYVAKVDEQRIAHILSPSLRELIITKLYQYDIEIVGTSLYIYRSKTFDLSHRQTVAQILALIDEVGATLKQGQRAELRKQLL